MAGFISEASLALSDALDYTLNVKVIARLIQPTVGGVCRSTGLNMLCLSFFFFGGDWTVWSLLSPSQKEGSAGWTSTTAPEPQNVPGRLLTVHAQTVQPEVRIPRSPLSAGAHDAVNKLILGRGKLEREREPMKAAGRGRI